MKAYYAIIVRIMLLSTTYGSKNLLNGKNHSKLGLDIVIYVVYEKSE